MRRTSNTPTKALSPAKYTTESSILLLPLLGNRSFIAISLLPGTVKFVQFGHEGALVTIMFYEVILTV
jgi:hypothetical protein